MFTNLYHSRVGFASDTLSVCNQPVHYIEWVTAYRDSTEDVWNLMTGLQKSDEPKQLTQDAFCNLFNGVEKLSLSRLVIGTDVNTLEIHPYSKHHIIVHLPDDVIFECRAKPPFQASVSETAQVLSTALHFADCTTTAQATNKLAKMSMLGIATDWDE